MDDERDGTERRMEQKGIQKRMIKIDLRFIILKYNPFSLLFNPLLFNFLSSYQNPSALSLSLSLSLLALSLSASLPVFFPPFETSFKEKKIPALLHSFLSYHLLRMQM